MIDGLRALASDLFTRSQLALRAGITFNGLRDLYQVLGYARTLRVQDYRDRYKRNGIAARIVDALPQATWRGGAELIEDEDPEVLTPFEEAFKELDKRLHIWSTLLRTDILAGMGEYSIMLIGAPGDFAAPLPSSLKPEAIAYLTPFGQDDANITEYVTDTKNERFGRPLFYEVKRTSTSASSQRRATFGAAARRVHWTRVIHVADNILDDEVFGQPRMQRVWNNLDDLDKVLGGGAEAFWRRVHQGMVFDLDKELEISPEEAERVRDAATEMQHDLRRVMSTRGMKLNMLGSDVANFSQQADAIITQIAGATGIPKRILVGSERGELASTQDKTNWDERVTDRRNEWAEPRVVRQFVDRLIEHRTLPEPEEYRVQWPELKQVDEATQADIAVKLASLNTAAGDVVVTAAEIRDKVLGWDPLSEEQIAEEEEKALAKQQEAMEMMQAEADTKNGAKPAKKEGEAPPRAALGKAHPRTTRGSRESTGRLTHIKVGSLTWYK